MFTGVVSAVDWTVNPKDGIWGVIDDDAVSVNGNGSDDVAFRL